MNERKTGAFLSYINIGIQTILGFVYVPLLLHYMGQHEYGLYQLMGSLIAYFGVMDFGLSTVVVRFYSKYKALHDTVFNENFLGFIQRLYIYISIAVVIIGCALYFSLDFLFSHSLSVNELVSAKYIYIFLLFNIIITLLGMMYRSVITANEKFLFLKGLETLQLVIQPFVVIAVMQISPTALAMVIVMTVINCVLTVFRTYYCYHQLHLFINYHFFDWNLFRQIKPLAISTFIVTIVDQLFWKTNQVVLGVISGTAIVAVYSIASLFYMSYMALAGAISGVFLPKITHMVVQKIPIAQLSNLFIKIGRLQYLLLALILSGFIIFGKEFIRLWAGNNFLDAYWITLIIMVPFTVDLIQNIGLSIMQAQNTYGFRAKIYSMVGILNLVLAIPLAVKYGGIGCAAATGVSMFIGNGLIMNWYYSSVTKLDIKEFWRQIGYITCSMLICLVIGYTLNSILLQGRLYFLIVKIVIYTVVYSIIMWVTVMNSYEKGLVIQMLRKIIHKK